jgi:rSAM/selenodomain-associated transferase 2
MQISIIIPVFNEVENLEHSLKTLLTHTKDRPDIEIILSDGGSTDGTIDLVQRYPVNIIHSNKGRAAQMNAGTRHARGNWLIFLHADTCLPTDWKDLIKHCEHEWGRFDVRLSGTHWLFRVIEKTMNFRSCTTSIATGDQAIFFRRDFFTRLEGFPEIPLMEDIAISKKARAVKSMACIRQPVITSSRRWEQNGILHTMFMMWYLRLAYWLGAKPETLHRLYYAKN